jgi:uncharacterized protein (DUF885 family)
MSGPRLSRRSVVAGSALLLARPALAAVGSESERLYAFFEEVWQRRVGRSAAMQSNLGVKAGRDQWPDIGEAHAAEDAAIARADLVASKRFDPAKLTPEAALSLRVFQYDAEETLTAYRWRLNRYPVCQMRGPQRSIPQTLMDDHPIAGRADAEAYVLRLHRVRPYMASIVDRLDLQARHGVRPPNFSYPLVIGNCENLLKGAPFDASGQDCRILADFKAKLARLDLDAAQKDLLIRNAEAGLKEGFGPGFRQLIEWLRSSEKVMTRNDGVWSLPDGEAYYVDALRMETTLPTPAAEVHRLGLREVARIHDRMKMLMPRLGVSGSLADLFAHARSSDAFYLPDTDEARARYLGEMRARIDEVLARLGEITSHTPRAKVEVRPVEPWLQASAGTAGYFEPPADGSRPGLLLVNQRSMRNLPTYEISALAYHEGVPGHHLERAVSRELTGLPKFRQFGGYTAYSEGWALYAEQLPLQMGLYRDAWQEFGQLSMELMRAGRLVLDTGLHALRWSREKAIAWADENLAANHKDNVTEVQRYIVTPGQACAYEMGKLTLMGLRDKARSRLGARFQVRAFNDAVLGNGPLPMPLLEENIGRWLARA